MPSSPGYVRNFKQEYATSKERGEQGVGPEGDGAKRMKLRRQALKRGMVHKGQDLDHRVALSKGGANTLANGRAETPHQNRSFPRRADGSMIRNVEETKPGHDKK
jgi:hypothetical protein